MKLGQKHTCFECGIKFYDLEKPAPVCPKCGVDQRLAPGSGYSDSRSEKRRRPGPPRDELPTREVSGELDAPGEVDDEFIEDTGTDYDVDEIVVPTEDVEGAAEDDDDSFG